MTGQQFFAIDYTFFLNLGFLAMSGALAWLWLASDTEPEHGEMADEGWIERLLFWLALASHGWLIGGVVAHFVAG